VKSTATTPMSIGDPLTAIVVPDAAASGEAVEDAAVLTVDERGMVRDCNHAGELLFRYPRRDLVWRHVSLLLPQLADLDLMPNGEPNRRLRFLCRIGQHLEAVTRDRQRFACDLFVNALDGARPQRLVLIVRPAGPAAGACKTSADGH